MSVIIYKNNIQVNHDLPKTYESIEWRDEFDNEHIEKYPNHRFGLYVVSNDDNIEEHWFDSKQERNSKLRGHN